MADHNPEALRWTGGFFCVIGAYCLTGVFLPRYAPLFVNNTGRSPSWALRVAMAFAFVCFGTALLSPSEETRHCLLAVGSLGWAAMFFVR